MASLMTSAIAALCVSAPGQYGPACTNAADAGTRQVGIRQQVDTIEEGTVKYATDETGKLLGSQKWVLGTALFTAKVVKEKKLQFKLPDIGVADTISNEVTPKSYGMKLEWRF